MTGHKRLTLVILAAAVLVIGGLTFSRRDGTAPHVAVKGAPSVTVVPSPAHISPSGAFPDATNTGVPPGTRLTNYTGPCQLPPGTFITAKIINCQDTAVQAMGPNVTVTRSQVNGRVLSDHSNGGSQKTSSISITDSIIDGGAQEEFPAVAYDSITLLRVEIVGGQHSFQCNSSCKAVDSYLHGQYEAPDSDGHFNAFISNGGRDFTLRHNTLWCSVPQTSHDGGCSGDASLFGDFAPIVHVTVDGNLFHETGGSYCFSGGFEPNGAKPYSASDVVVRNNVFQRGRNRKCGYFGAVTSVGTAAQGFLFRANTFDDSSPLT
jgi:hypothetical protein